MSVVRSLASIVLVADCGGDVGWGHFVRCQALAQELRGRGCDVELYVNGELPAFGRAGGAHATGQPHGSAGSLSPAFDGADAVVLDLRQYSATTRDGLPRTALVATLVDGQDPPFASDLTVDPNVGAKPATSSSRLAGPEYVILRPELDGATARNAAPPSGSLFVSFGGTERGELISRVLAAAAPVFPHITVVAPTALVGSRGDNRSAAKVSWLTSVRDMGELLLGVEAGLISAGTLLHEACATGLACAVVALSPDQELEARAFAVRDAILYLGPFAELTDQRLRSGLVSLGDSSLRARLAGRARRLVDGRGRARVADALLARLADRVQG